MSNERALRVAQSIKRELADMLRRDLKDPRLSGLISFTEVEVTSDLRNVKAFVSVFGTASGAAAGATATTTEAATPSAQTSTGGANGVAKNASSGDDDDLDDEDDDDDLDDDDDDDFDDEDGDDADLKFEDEMAKKARPTAAVARGNHKPAHSQARGRNKNKNNQAEMTPAEKATQGVLDCLNEESGYIRGEICRRLKLRFAPELIFLPDVSLERGSKVSEILAKISRGEV